MSKIIHKHPQQMSLDEIEQEIARLKVKKQHTKSDRLLIMNLIDNRAEKQFAEKLKGWKP